MQGSQENENERNHEDMRVIAIMNQKGGVGKTVTTVNVAATLANDYAKRVLAVDADPQANTTEFFGGLLAGACSLGDLLRRIDVNEPIRPSNFPGVWLLGADDSLMDLDLSSVKSKAADVAALANLLAKREKDFDFVLIDCPPAFNAASAAALLAADDVVIPIKPDAFSLRGMANLLRQIRNMQEINPALRLAGLLPTMVYRSEQVKKAMEILQASDFHVFTPIRRTTKVDDMTFAQRPLVLSSPKSAACQDYRRFVRELVRGGAGHGV